MRKLILGWYPQPVQETVNAQAEHLENYNESVFGVCFLLCSQSMQEALSFSSPPLPITNPPLQDPHLLVNHQPGAIGWSETKEDESKRKRGRMKQGGVDVSG